MVQRTLAFICSSPEDDRAAARIATFIFDEAIGTFTALAETTHVDNPTFLAVDPARRRVFVAGETLQSTVTAYRLDPADGRLHFINARPTLGQYAAHVAIDFSGSTVFVTNYSADIHDPDSKGVAVYAVGDDGELSPPVWSAAFEGSGPVEIRQASTHPHSALLSPDERLLIIPDLGIDRLLCFAFDAKSRSIRPAVPPYVPLPPGSGPRHAQFSADGRYLYVVNELASTVSVVEVNGGMQIIQTISSLPPSFRGQNISADVQMTRDGGRLFVSNRGHNCLAAFTIDEFSGRLRVVGQTPVAGDWPRNFAIDPSGRFVIVANQRSHQLVVFTLDPATGALAETGYRLEIAQPMCIKFARL